MQPGCARLREVIRETVLGPKIAEFLVALSFYRGEGRQGVRRLLFPVCREMLSLQNCPCDKQKREEVARE